MRLQGVYFCSKYIISLQKCDNLLTPVSTKMSYKKQPPEVFCKKGVLKNLANFTGKHLCSSLFLILKRDSNTPIFL